MKITLIKREKPHLVRFFTDNGKDFAIDLDLATETGLKTGDNITEEEISRLCETSDYVRAKDRALWYLERAERTEKELYDKLIKAGFSKKASAKALARLKELGLVDDERYARRKAEYLAEKNTSGREIYEKLMQKGISKTLINSVLEDTEIDEASQISALIEKKYKNKLTDFKDRKEVDKVYAALARKGFSFGAIRDALKAYSQELELTSEEF